MQAQRILGVDPGSRLTGYGCVDLVGNQLQHVGNGTLRLSNTGGKATIPLETRLHSIYVGLSEVIERFRPQVLCVEKVFFAKNAVSALKLGQARGVVLLTGKLHGLQIEEYSPSEVKQTVVGHGLADKAQVAAMVGLLLGIQGREFATSDASDALALAICHAHRAGFGGAAQRPLADFKRGPKGRSLAETLGLTPERVAGKRRFRLGAGGS
jgi:crossover junction endodeoxyribonuclease RuvC